MDERDEEDAAAAPDEGVGEDHGVAEQADDRRPPVETGVHLAGQLEEEVHRGPRDAEQQRRRERRHRRQQPGDRVAAPRDLLREGRDQHDQRDDDDRGEDLVEDADRRVAQRDGDADDGECPGEGKPDERIPGSPVGPTDRHREEPSEGAIALAPGEQQREHHRAEREDERDERRRDAPQRRCRGQAEAQAGKDKDGADTAGADSARRMFETPGWRRSSGHRAAP